MIRWTLLLCAGLFSAMLVLGQDRGQQRLGLVEARTTLATRNIVAPSVPHVAETTTVTQVSVSFSPTEPLIAPVNMGEDKATEQAASSSAAEPVLRFVRSNRTNLRAGPGKEFAVRGKLARGQKVELVGMERAENGWVLVRFDGVRGYVSADLLSDKAL
jgi:hypothetical protein